MSDDKELRGTKGTWNGTGPVALVEAVLELAVQTVAACLRSESDGTVAKQQYEEAVVSWGWLCGLHAKRMPASLAYEVAGMDTRDAVEVFTERFERINAKRFRQIDKDARECPAWVLPLPRGYGLPLYPH
jgi:hypothetical protein